MLENKYSKLTKTKRRLYILINAVKIFLMIALVAFSDMLIISGMRTLYKQDLVMSAIIVGIRAIIVISALGGMINFSYQIIGFARDKYILKKIHIKGTDSYREIIVHIRKIPKEIVDELFK